MTTKKIQLWDIEATNLNANFGYILSIAVKDLDEKKVRVYSIADYPRYKKDPTNDKDLVRDAAADLGSAGVWVTWYGARFDVPFVNTRLIGHGLPPMPPVPHIDGWRIAKYKLKMNSNRLASVSGFLNVEEKTPLNGPIWIKASAGDKKSLDYIVEHNIQDVIVLEQVYHRIRPLITSGPNVSLLQNMESAKGVNACPICASLRLQKRGLTSTATTRKQRYQCQDCGGWSIGKATKVEGVDVR